MLEVDAVQHGADEPRLDLPQLLDRGLRRLPAGHLRADHEHHAGGAVRDERRVGHRHHRRRVDDHPVEVVRQRRRGSP